MSKSEEIFWTSVQWLRLVHHLRRAVFYHIALPTTDEFFLSVDYRTVGEKNHKFFFPKNTLLKVN